MFFNINILNLKHLKIVIPEECPRAIILKGFAKNKCHAKNKH